MRLRERLRVWAGESLVCLGFRLIGFRFDERGPDPDPDYDGADPRAPAVTLSERAQRMRNDAAAPPRAATPPEAPARGSVRERFERARGG